MLVEAGLGCISVSHLLNAWIERDLGLFLEWMYKLTPTAPVRYGSIGWKTMMNHYKEQLLACDFFTVETVFLRTVYVLVFIELGTRRVHLAGMTSHPDGQWVAQQARQLVWKFEEAETNFRCLIRDNDSKYTEAFDNVFESQQTRIIPTPIRAPNANSYMER